MTKKRPAKPRTPAAMPAGKDPAEGGPVARKRRSRTLLPEFAAMMARPPGNDLQADLDDIRGDR
jgi:hypothetical protein